MPITNRELAPGTILVATFKKVTYRCEVMETEKGLRYHYAETEFKSPSAAASAVVHGAANGWRFWAIEDAETVADEQAPKPEKARKVSATKTTKAPTPEAASEVEDEPAPQA